MTEAQRRLSDAVTLLATGIDLVGAGRGVRSFDGMLEELIEGARQKIQIAAYRFDPDFLRYFDLLEKRAEEGVEVVIVCDALERNEASVRQRIERLSPRINMFDYSARRRDRFEILHTKVMVVDGRHAIVGSANFGFGGLVTNVELGVYLTGATPWKLADMLDHLASVCRRNGAGFAGD
ncbi:phospholipase D-like domain-containing protein [Deinococcus sp. S9]|uniref:phospholipase D-like domain-containing protein n=1 Tax=Deinococcus sp. S9 TaxID=2545754 RepID=UPI0010561596|nr:phospholipase D-like domain-containing protein [Deinococcus sp. S9]TDE84702.1 hypothetical protein E0686_15710 [Deinococcus sp. S9]